MRMDVAPCDINLGAVVRAIRPDFLVDCLTGGAVCSPGRQRCLTGIMSGALRA